VGEQTDSTAPASAAATPSMPDFMEDRGVDPHARYAELRAARCPVVHVATVSTLNPYVVTDYEHCRAALADPRLRKDPHVGVGPLTRSGIFELYLGETFGMSRSMLQTDPPDHTRLRRIVAGEFTTRRTAALRPRVQQIADELLDAFDPAGSTDFVAAFADQLPALVIAELLGIPTADLDEFRRWSQEFLHPEVAIRRAGTIALTGYLARHAQLKREQPGDDLLSALAASRAEDRLTEAEVRGTAFLLVVAGHETTTNLLGNGLLALLQHPDQLEALRADPSLIPEAVEELLRYDGPVERSTARWASEDMDIAGMPIPAGETVITALASANRDEEVFADADTLDITRSPRGHLAFGYGIHFCLGAPLARLEAQVGFETVLRRLPGLRLAVPPESLAYRPSTLMRALKSLPIGYSAVSPRG
jgi:cytochrome P450